MKYQATIFTVVLAFSLPGGAAAQITVQQPVFERFGVNTSVSVPDGGWAHLGSVSRAESSRRQQGFFQPGSSIGYSRSHTGVSVGVRIIDLAEMDRMILGYDPSMMPHGHYSRPVAQSAQQIKQEKAQLTASRKPGLSSAWLKLGMRAEERGKLDRARDCYARATANGSTEAKQRLAALKKGTLSSATTTLATQILDVQPRTSGPRLIPQTP